MMNSNKKNVDISDVIREKEVDKRNELYKQYVENVTPKHNMYKNMWRAFLVGGLICMLGQILINIYMNMGASKEDAQMYNMITLILLSVIFTGTGLYAKLAKYGGAGALVPITGFANSVASPAIEFKKEGQVFGIGCKIFTISGPVILYGIFTSWVLGLIYWVLKMFGVM